MMEILIILLSLSVIGICVIMKRIADLNKRIAELEKKISNMQYQIDDVLCDINVANNNVLNTYGLLIRTEEKK